MKFIISLSIRALLFEKHERIYSRVLFLDKFTDSVFLFRFSESTPIESFTERFSYSQVIDDVKSKKLLIIDSDPFAAKILDDELSSSAKALRDRAWSQISTLIRSEPGIYTPEIRNKLINAATKNSDSATKPTLYKWLKLYWRNGMVPNALVPKFNLCGLPGVEKHYCNLSLATKNVIKKGFKEFYLKAGNTFRDARMNTMRTYCKQTKNQKFTIDQFIYWGKKSFSESEILQYRVGHKYYNANKRLLHGRATDIADGPGKLFQIDWTLIDIAVVATHNRDQYVGRPFLYVVVDTFSRAIVGVLLTFENPSYITACNALYNAGRDKVEFAKECGLAIKQEDWPLNLLPSRIICDRGELLSYNAESIVNNLNVTVDTTAAYRPDLKSIVEKLMHTIQQRVLRVFKDHGHVNKRKSRIEKDTRKEASVTLSELYQIAVACVIEFNNHHWIDAYPLTVEMSADKVRKVPIDIFKWGCDNGIGIANVWDKETLWLNLLPQKKITATKKGITINKQDYIPCDQADFQLLDNIIDSQSRQVIVSYDPRIYSEIYWIHKRKFIKLRLRGDHTPYQNEWDLITTNDSYEVTRKDIKAKEEEIQLQNDERFYKHISLAQKNKTVKLKGAKKAKKNEVTIERKNIQRLSGKKNEMPAKYEAQSKYSKPSYSNELKTLDEI